MEKRKPEKEDQGKRKAVKKTPRLKRPEKRLKNWIRD